ncbi:MAG TPA: hypothetical protein VFU89_03400 [Rhabdochlamydiaceae bacterium]|nr:hypothetical protein [Rhabdochlamydiaceae bacterium]
MPHDISCRTAIAPREIPLGISNPDVHGIHQAGNVREQDLPGHIERLNRARAFIGQRKWNDFDGASIIKETEATRGKFDPEILAIVLVIISIVGAVFFKHNRNFNLKLGVTHG